MPSVPWFFAAIRLSGSHKYRFLPDRRIISIVRQVGKLLFSFIEFKSFMRNSRSFYPLKDKKYSSIGIINTFAIDFIINKFIPFLTLHESSDPMHYHISNHKLKPEHNENIVSHQLYISVFL